MNFRRHARYEAMLGAFVLGEAPEADRTIVVAHASVCAPCRSAIEGARRSQPAFRELRASDTWTPSVYAEVGARVDAARHARVRHVASGIGAATALSFAFNLAFVSGALTPVARALRGSGPGRFAVVRVREERARLGPVAAGTPSSAEGRWETRLSLLASAGLYAASHGSTFERELFNHDLAPVGLARLDSGAVYRTGTSTPADDSPALQVDAAAYRPLR